MSYSTVSDWFSDALSWDVSPTNTKSYLNDLPRAFLRAYAAVRTFICIDVCKKVIYSDSTGFTVPFTEPASDTSHLTYIHQGFSLFVRIALNECLLLVRNQFDQMFRTGSYTFAASLAGFFVYDGNTVHDVDRVKGAGGHAGAITEAPVCTAFRTAVLHLACHNVHILSLPFRRYRRILQMRLPFPALRRLHP